MFTDIQTPITLLLLDYGNVIDLVQHRKVTAAFAEQYNLDETALHRKIFGNPGPAIEFECGRLQSNEFQHQMEEILQRTFSPARFREIFCDMFQPLAETRKLARWASGHVKIGLLSNTNQIHYEEHIRACDIFSLFEQITLSYEVGAMKPDSAIFEDAIRKHQQPPETILYVDDIPAYVEGARATGIQAFHFEGPQTAISLLEALKTIYGDP